MNFWSPVRGNEAAFMHTHTFIIPVLTLNNVWILKKRYHVQAGGQVFQNERNESGFYNPNPPNPEYVHLTTRISVHSIRAHMYCSNNNISTSYESSIYTTSTLEQYSHKAYTIHKSSCILYIILARSVILYYCIYMCIYKL